MLVCHFARGVDYESLGNAVKPVIDCGARFDIRHRWISHPAHLVYPAHSSGWLIIVEHADELRRLVRVICRGLRECRMLCATRQTPRGPEIDANDFSREISQTNGVTLWPGHWPFAWCQHCECELRSFTPGKR